METRDEIIREAEAAHSQYPQYEGHWMGEEWVLVCFSRRVETKLGVAFEPGDVTIAKFPPAWMMRNDPYASVTAYSRRNGIDTSVWAFDLSRVEDTPLGSVEEVAKRFGQQIRLDG